MEPEEMLNVKWDPAFKDRGFGHGDYGIMANGILILECPNEEIAYHIINLHNESMLAA